MALLEPFVERVHLFHGKACEDAGVEPATLPIVLDELTFNRSAFESDFAATPEARQVRIIWNGIASLWAFGQGPSELPAPCTRRCGPRSGNPARKLKPSLF